MGRDDIVRLLRELGAPERLLVHLALVGDAAAQLIDTYEKLGVPFDASLVELGAAVHDAGKILYPAELDGPGSAHEAAGERLLLEHGVPPRVARCCVSHAAWSGPDVTLEERTVALADKLWKGKREPELELLVVDEVGARLGVERWDVYPGLDAVFEAIAADGDDRLRRSRSR